MSEQSEMKPIQVRLRKGQIADLIYKELEDDIGDADQVHARQAIDFAIEALDRLGLIVRES